MTSTSVDQFISCRRRYLGGTDIAAICGLSPWATALTVYLDKTGDEHQREETLAMRRGLALEHFIAKEFERARPQLVCYRPRPIVREDWGFPAGASLDRLVAAVEHPRTPIALLEAKTAFRRGWQQFDMASGDMPDHYYAQVQWYLAVSELPLAYAAADVGDDDLRIIEVRPDRTVQEALIESGRRFWRDHVERRLPPPPDGSEHDRRILSRAWRDTVAEPVADLSATGRGLLAEYLANKQKADEHSRAAEAARQRLCALMGKHETATIDGWRLSWKRQTRTTIDAKALRAAHPHIAEEFSRTTETRRFSVADQKETT